MVPKNIKAILIVLLFTSRVLYAQDPDVHLDVYSGLRAGVGQFNHFQFDLGYGALIDGPGRHHCFIIDAAIEARNFHRDAVYGPKIYFAHIEDFYNVDFGLLTGIGFIGYTDFQRGYYPCLRPDIGISLTDLVDITYGYNFFMNEIPGNAYFNRHLISMVVRIGLIYQLTTEYHT